MLILMITLLLHPLTYSRLVTLNPLLCMIIPHMSLKLIKKQF